MVVVRKNLMVDAEALRDLARERGTSESEAVRDAVTFALAAQEMVTAIKGLNALGAFADFEQVYGGSLTEVGRVAESGGAGGTGKWARRPRAKASAAGGSGSGPATGRS